MLCPRSRETSQSKVEHFDGSVGGQHDIGGLQIACVRCLLCAAAIASQNRRRAPRASRRSRRASSATVSAVLDHFLPLEPRWAVVNTAEPAEHESQSGADYRLDYGAGQLRMS